MITEKNRSTDRRKKLTQFFREAPWWVPVLPLGSIAMLERAKEGGTALSGKTRPRSRRAPTPDVERKDRPHEKGHK
ncbi:hypothetical protein [Pontibacter ummariensis]|uniref:hypothetical protein n=1 Tax=Pontibacter ummariensis TaxID=1610492 RepID=UPI000B78E4A7|nr:hypothetical protein [Pontibacter ummariensis]